ncbi:MAG: glycoside hydrolase family protein [Victivallaceae bacterium]|nr:glycoside hydrolase family protein [Victivallaceae bacterium]
MDDDRKTMLCYDPASGLREDGSWVWCGSVAPGKDGWHMYASRWSKKYPMFDGYILTSEIVHAYSKTPDGAYRIMEKVFPTTPLRMAHNPTILKYKQHWLLYFIATTYEGEATPENFTKQQVHCAYANIRIYAAEAPSPKGPWTMFPNPILSPEPGSWESGIVTNPAPCVAPDGRIYLYYRSNPPGGLRIGLAVADDPAGPYRRPLRHPVLEGFDVEDPFVWHDGNVFRMYAKDMTGAITGELHAGGVFVSEDGVHWSFAGQGYSRTLRERHTGKTIELGCLERPQIFFSADGSVRYLCVAAADGPGGFCRADHTWNTIIKL